MMFHRCWFLLISIVRTIASFVANQSIHGLHIQIFDNIAEITQPIEADQLPVQFNQQEWFDIRPDSIRLVGYCLTIRGQIIDFKQSSLNGQRVMIQRSSTNDTYTEAIIIDENRNLIHDLTDNTFYTVSTERIRYLFIPPIRNYSVNFSFERLTPTEPMYLRYLQKNIKWTARYDLLFEGNNSAATLQAYADIRNDGSSHLTIDFAELISGDVNIQSTSSSENYYNGAYMTTPASVSQDTENDYGSGSSNGAPTISTAQELQGFYIFTINETFTLNPRSNFILPMIAPQVIGERYGLIEKFFSIYDNQDNAQRAYRIRVSDTYLPRGQVFVRESDRLVGETYWSDLAANETNEFTLGSDPDLRYNELIQLNSRRQAYEANGYRFILSTYTINLLLINSKPRSINIEYRLKFSSQDSFTLKQNTVNNTMQFEGSTLVGIFPMAANEEQQVKFTFETK